MTFTNKLISSLRCFCFFMGVHFSIFFVVFFLLPFLLVFVSIFYRFFSLLFSFLLIVRVFFLFRYNAFTFFFCFCCYAFLFFFLFPPLLLFLIGSRFCYLLSPLNIILVYSCNFYFHFLLRMDLHLRTSRMSMRSKVFLNRRSSRISNKKKLFT